MVSFTMYFFGMFLILNLLMMNLCWFQNLFFFLMFIMILFYINIKYYNYYMMIFMDYGVDKISFLLMILSLWILGLMLMSSLNLLKNYQIYFMLQMLMLIFSLMMFFYSMDLINFYLFFEISLIPIFMMILGWGFQPERLQAGLYMLIYTLIVSLPFFCMLIFIMGNLFTLNMMMMMVMKLYLNNFFVCMFMMLIFLVKLPIYFIHLWLPKAHVEAPIFGSMVLAGVMLKLGGYGFMRFFMFYLMMMKKFSLMLIIYIFVGSVNISILCLRQIDLKMLIAYSSIVHMGFMIIGIMMNYELSLNSGLIMMIGHGLCSSGLFCLLNFNYKRLNSRSILFNKGLLNYFPNMSMMWFLFCVMNMAAPPSLNLVAEVFLIMVILKFSLMFIFMLILLSFFSGVYSIFLYSFTQHGMNFFNNISFNFNTIDEFMLMILHWIPMNIFILNLTIMS